MVTVNLISGMIRHSLDCQCTQTGGKGERTDMINLSWIGDRGRLTFLSVAQRFSLSPEVQTQISSLQNTRTDCEESSEWR